MTTPPPPPGNKTDSPASLADDIAAGHLGAILTREEMAAIVGEVMEKLAHKVEAGEAQIFRELYALAAYIKQTRAEVAALKPSRLKTVHLNSATDELEEVIGATEDATNQIMDCCDKIMALGTKLPEADNATLQALVNGVYEACSFQDIVGQRITKVVRTLVHIEEQISRLVAAVGAHEAGAHDDDEPVSFTQATDTEKHLLNGPQAADKAHDQDEIDRLLASFDEPAK